MNNIIISEDGKKRCKWCAVDEAYIAYHDDEWGYPVGDDIRLFEKICLEGFQSGLSWRTILMKRENFRNAFAGFDYNKIAEFNDEDIARLIEDKGIVRHRGKIEAVINNAKRAKELIAIHGSLAKYFWGFEPKNKDAAIPQSQSTSDTSIALSKELKKLGWKFVGPTTIFAFMQAMGLINDHALECDFRKKADFARENFKAI